MSDHDTTYGEWLAERAYECANEFSEWHDIFEFRSIDDRLYAFARDGCVYRKRITDAVSWERGVYRYPDGFVPAPPLITENAIE